MLTAGPNLGLLDDGSYGEDVYTETLRMYRAIDTLVQPRVKSISVLSQPSAPDEGDAYIVPFGATGDWSTSVGDVARWTSRTAAIESKWEFFTPKRGWEFSVDDLDCKVKFDGNNWVGSGIVVRNYPPDDNDGRPDGTMYIQVN